MTNIPYLVVSLIEILFLVINKLYKFRLLFLPGFVFSFFSAKLYTM